ncbi:hypothetical protein GCM10009733_040450 [Nonomuraea maheshkhaliensis]|uniref:Tetratricopeptide repeat protein n=1 Tax=Nonomuraea maheshkhaliensis TaxID=419590 RepID=A0ABN2FBE9_9ACTN
MTSIDLDLVPTVHPVRTYLDLGGSGGALHNRILAHLATAMAAGEQVTAVFQSNPVSGLRDRVVRETRLSAYAARTPDRLAEEHRSARWQRLCECLTSWDDQPPRLRSLLVNLLIRLGFYGEAEKRLRDLPLGGPLGDVEVSLLLQRASAVYKSDRGADERALSLLRHAYEQAVSPRARLVAAMAVTVHHARVDRDARAVSHWAGKALAELAAFDGAEDDDVILRSAALRACSFAPFFDRRLDEATEMLARCEELARSAPDDTAERRLARDENLRAVLETRSREAAGRGDTELSLQRMRDLTLLDPADSRAHRDLGYALFKLERFAQALDSFRTAARLGSPFAAVSWTLMAHCHLRLNDTDAALDALMTALDIDPRSITALQGVLCVTERRGDGHLRAWAHERLNRLPAPPSPDSFSTLIKEESHA